MLGIEACRSGQAQTALLAGGALPAIEMEAHLVKARRQEPRLLDMLLGVEDADFLLQTIVAIYVRQPSLSAPKRPGVAVTMTTDFVGFR